MIGILAGILFSSWGWWLLWWFPDSYKRLALAPFWGMSVVGLVMYVLWLAHVPWQCISLAWLFGGGLGILAAGRCLFQAGSTFENPVRGFRPSSLAQLLLMAITLTLTAIVIMWNILMQGVVWDALVLYDWRGLRIAEGWQLGDFFMQFQGHPEFYAYDFSHPFLDAVWRAAIFSLGGNVTTGVFLVPLAGLLAYAWKMWRRQTAWWWLLLMMVGTQQSLTTWTQGYSALPYFLWWVLVLLITLDMQLSLRIKTSLLLVFLMANMLLRVSEPFWLVFAFWWLLQIWQHRIYWKTKVALSTYWLAPILAVFIHWQQLQAEAVSLSQVDEGVRSSYSLAQYAPIEVILSQPLWWGQSIWLLMFHNPSASITVLSLGIVFWWMVQQQVWRDRSLWNYLFLGASWWAMVAVALLFEISGDPENWLSKGRLLWRVSLPLTAWAIVASSHWLKRMSSSQVPRIEHGE